MSLSLKDREWKEFILEKLFTIKSTSSSIDRNKLNGKKGVFPYITRTERNNGLDHFIGIQDDIFKIDKSNVITIGLDTQTIFYQPHPFYTGQNIQILKSEHLNKDVAYFIMPLIKIQMQKFNWGGNGATLTRLKRQKILLPITTEGEPDYSFMEHYMRRQEATKQAKYKAYITQRLEKLKSSNAIEPLNSKEWKEFFIIDIFTDIQRGKRLKKEDHKRGNIPYASSTAMNNGIDGFIGNKDKIRIFNNCLTLANSGSVGATFYQPFEVIASDHVTKLEESTLNKYSYLFIANMVNRLGEKYSFNREINDKRIKREKIMLPINTNNEPDYEYMEKYMKAIEYKKLKAYLDWKQ